MSVKSTYQSNCRSLRSTSSAKHGGPLMASGQSMSVLASGLSHRTAPVALLERVSVTGDAPRQAAARRAAGRLRGRGHGRLDLQPGRGLRRGRPVPRRRHAVTEPAQRSTRACPWTSSRRTSTCTTRTRPSSTCSRWCAAWTRWSWARARSSARSATALKLAQEAGHGRRHAERAGPAGAAGRQARAHRDRHRPGRAPRWSARASRSPGEPRPARGQRALVVGAGSMSSLAAATLARAGVTDIVVANRTYERGVRLARDGRRPGGGVRRPSPASWPRPTSSSPAPARAVT